ncbi:MAG: hypothetical protein ACQEWU_10070 [Bacillota bacterium]|uniref:hypothetical protein n=1 Tax=Virgibacillus sp. Bac332 TaxID=2419842 RepID=UPI000EF52640|nr:hypothetical protein [Virgibacillus sp. Bac332]
MITLTTTLFIVLALLVIVSEIYKANFERKKESMDERGELLIFKIKSFSYSILTGGILLGVALVAILDVIHKEYFIYYVMIIFFIQSIVSSIYLAVAKRI